MVPGVNAVTVRLQVMAKPVTGENELTTGSRRASFSVEVEVAQAPLRDGNRVVL